MRKRIRNFVFDLRSAVGESLLHFALAVMPRESTTREGICRGNAEQAQYDRYAAYTKICGQAPFPFDRWREIWGTMKLRAERQTWPRPTQRRAVRFEKPRAAARL